MAQNYDLVLERTLNAPRDLVWKAWTDPKLLKQWFAPKPYEISGGRNGPRRPAASSGSAWSGPTASIPDTAIPAASSKWSTAKSWYGRAR